MRVALVGAGYVASRHLIGLRELPNIEIVGICDLDQDRAAALAKQFQIGGVYRSLAEMAAATKPQVVHILTPPASHCSLTLEALDLGCHVFVEKPMADTVEECERMIAAAKAKNLVLSVNHSARFEPPVLEALELVRKGAIGDILAVHHFRGSDYPAYAGGKIPAIYRQGSYPFRDLGVHALYVFEAFLGQVQSLRVMPKSTGREPMLTFDEWHADATCAKGHAYAWMSWNMQPVRNEFWIQGTRGAIDVNCFLQSCKVHRTYPGPKQLHAVINGMRHAASSLKNIPLYLLGVLTGRVKPSPGIIASVQAFHKALAANQPPPVPAEEGLRSIAWVLEGSKEADAAKDALEAQRVQPPVRAARVLVTGANGFLGGALLKRLREAGETPRLLLRRPSAQNADLEAVYGSLGDPDTVDRAVAGVEVVYHVGAAMKGGTEEFQAGTVLGTRNIVQSCIRHKVKKLVYVSSMGLLDHAGHPAGTPVTENSPYEPYPERRGIYTGTKMTAERELLTEAEKAGLDAVVLRPGQIFGKGAELVTPNGVIRLAGRWLVYGNGSRPLPLVYVEDVVDGLIAAETASPAASRQIIHLVDPAVVTQNQYLTAARHVLEEERIPVVRVPQFILLSLGWMVDILSALAKRPLPLSVYRVRSLRPLAPNDASKAKQLLGWTPRTGVSRGLSVTFPAAGTEQ
ncbi:hypothetical protein F183_A55120 (plasmid) [Bryobacterales bacterium F-183]|nr:hypothetical protein F183_A55120 [Bryobacterales bacterium F-183]